MGRDKIGQDPYPDRRRDLQPAVRPPELTSYYGRPILKQPTWKNPDVPLYFFVGGLAGASATLAPLARATGRRRLARVARLVASGGALAGSGLLVHDLGRPARFLHMLRVFKPTSPLSVGSWILSSFGGLSTLSALSAETGIATPIGRAAEVGAAALGPALSTYTAVLVADTAVPAWHEAHRELPVVFAGSSAAAVGGLALVSVGGAEAAPGRRLGVAGAAVELAAGAVMERRLAALPGGVAEAYRTGKAGRWLRASRWLLGLGAAGAVTARRSRSLSAASGVLLMAGSLATRFGVFEAGRQSAADPAHTVGPQRERRERSAADDGRGKTLMRVLSPVDGEAQGVPVADEGE
jgi:formate-dependent nitrite reductase membrane component NrfD